jgi:hypothetical protein
MTESAEFMRRIEAKLDRIQATVDSHGKHLLALRVRLVPGEAPVMAPELVRYFLAGAATAVLLILTGGLIGAATTGSLLP